MKVIKFILPNLIIFFLSKPMELPIAPSSERRPVEESMFELFVQQKERMDSLEQVNKDAAVQILELSAQNAHQRVNNAKAQLEVDQATRNRSTELLKLVIESQGTAEQAQQKLRQQLVEQAQEINGMHNQIRDINTGHQQLQLKAAANAELLKWAYIAGGVVVLGGGIALLALAVKNGKLEDDQKKLSDQVAGLKWKVDLKEHAANQKAPENRSIVTKCSIAHYQREQDKKDVAEMVNDLKKVNEELQLLKASSPSTINQTARINPEFQKNVETVIENTDALNENLTFLMVKDRVTHLEKEVASLQKRPFVSQAGPNAPQLVLNVPNQQNPSQVQSKPIKDAKLATW